MIVFDRGTADRGLASYTRPDVGDLKKITCWCLVVAAASCTPEEGPSLVAIPDTPPSLRVAVGTGESSFEDVAEGADVWLAYGNQGGWHVWTAVKEHDLSVTEARINLRSRFEDGSVAGDPSSVAVRLGDVEARASTRGCEPSLPIAAAPSAVASFCASRSSRRTEGTGRLRRSSPPDELAPCGDRLDQDASARYCT